MHYTDKDPATMTKAEIEREIAFERYVFGQRRSLISTLEGGGAHGLPSPARLARLRWQFENHYVAGCDPVTLASLIALAFVIVILAHDPVIVIAGVAFVIAGFAAARRMYTLGDVLAFLKKTITWSDVNANAKRRRDERP